MKKLAISLGLVAALVIGVRAQAETINWAVVGWQTTCSATNFTFTATSTDCTFYGTSVGRLSGGTITGSAQFVGDSVSGGTLTVTSSIYVTSSTPGVGPATIGNVAWYGLAQYGDPAGLTVVTGGNPVFNCSPTSDVICNTPNTPLPVANIDIYGAIGRINYDDGGAYTTSNTEVKFLVNALASSSTNMVWQCYTLTIADPGGSGGNCAPIPEPGTALLLGVGLLALGVSGWRRH